MVYNGLPWNRSTELSPKDIYNLYMKDVETSEKVDCNRVSPYCKSLSDCSSACGDDYNCEYHRCVKPRSKKNTVTCSKKNGGIIIQTIDGDAYCYCTKPAFYIGNSCETINPMIKDAVIDPDFDGVINDELVKYISCEDSEQSPVMIRGYISCLHPDTISSFKHIYVVDE